MASDNEQQHIPTAVPVQAVPVQAVPVQQGAMPSNTVLPQGQVAGYAQTGGAPSAGYPPSTGFVAPNYNATPVSPELQVMDANQLGGEGQVVKPQAAGASAVMPGFEFIGGRRQFVIKQRFEMVEALAGAVGLGCVEYRNKYDVFDVHTKQPLLYAEESSGTCMRCCCKPHHELKLKVFDVTRGNPQEIQPAMIVDKPFRLGCCTCADICSDQHSTMLVNGDKPVGSAKKHIPCGGWFTPQIDLANASGQNDGAIHGPFCCVGGLIELCQDINFRIVDASGSDIGKVIKKKPDDWEARLKEAAGDSDMFYVELAASVSDEKTANIIATALLMDYIFFEGGSPIAVDPVEGSIQCNCCTCYCCGCLCPCACQCGGNNGEGGGEG